MDELVIASSPVDNGISCWDLQSGAEQLRYKSCASPPHGLICVGQRFLASSQLRESSSSSGSVLYWSWVKPQVEVKSFPAERIQPLVSNPEGTYIIGGGVNGNLYLWEVSSGRLLHKWHGHYRAVTCLVISDENSLLISGSEDGCVRVWSLVLIFDDILREEANRLYEHSFNEHTLRVTDIVCGYGGFNEIIVSASEDRTCKVWSLTMGKLLRNIVFPSVIDAIALDPGELVFYAGSRDGKTYIAALSAERTPSGNYGKHIIGSLSDHSKAVTCLAFGTDGTLLVSGSVDGMIRIWDTKTHNIVRILKHGKGPVNNVVIVKRSLSINLRPSLNSQLSLRKHGSSLPPPLDKYANSKDEDVDTKAVLSLHLTSFKPLEASYLSSHVISSQIKELQQQGSAAGAEMEMEMERMKIELERSRQMEQQWKKMYDNLHQFCVDELMDEDQARAPIASSPET